MAMGTGAGTTTVDWDAAASTAARTLKPGPAVSLDEARDLVHQLGSRWIPPSREALVALLTNAARPRGPKSR